MLMTNKRKPGDVKTSTALDTLGTAAKSSIAGHAETPTHHQEVRCEEEDRAHEEHGSCTKEDFGKASRRWVAEPIEERGEAERAGHEDGGSEHQSPVSRRGWVISLGSILSGDEERGTNQHQERNDHTGEVDEPPRTIGEEEIEIGLKPFECA